MAVKIKCDYCPLEIEGATENQVGRLMAVHKINKHPDKVKLVEIKK